MSRCEDFPCCGHEAGDCPDGEGRMKCVECGDRLPSTAHSSICDACKRQFERTGRWRNEPDDERGFYGYGR